MLVPIAGSPAKVLSLACLPLRLYAVLLIFLVDSEDLPYVLPTHLFLFYTCTHKHVHIYVHFVLIQLF
jgi:hypothetical protein